jgi:membrane-associated phospholipid phosphatase
VTRPPPPDQRSDAELPGLPGFRSWRGVYLFVLGWFALVVILLVGFSRIFS